MPCENEAARVWAALLGMALLIALTLTVGYWLNVYHREARELEPILGEKYSAIDLILDDLPQIPRY